MQTPSASNSINQNFQLQPHPNLQNPKDSYTIVSQMTSSNFQLASLFSQTTVSSLNSDLPAQSSSQVLQSQPSLQLYFDPNYFRQAKHSSQKNQIEQQLTKPALMPSIHDFNQNSQHFHPISVKSTATKLTASFQNLKKQKVLQYPLGSHQKLTESTKENCKPNQFEQHFLSKQANSLQQQTATLLSSSEQHSSSLKFSDCQIVSRDQPSLLLQMKSIKYLDRWQTLRVNQAIGMQQSASSNRTLQLIYNSLPRKYLKKNFQKTLKNQNLEKKSLILLRKNIKQKDNEQADLKSITQQDSNSKTCQSMKESSIFSTCSKRCSVPPLVSSKFKQQSFDLQKCGADDKQHAEKQIKTKNRSPCYKSRAIKKKPKLRTLVQKEILLKHSRIKKCQQQNQIGQHYIQYDRTSFSVTDKQLKQKVSEFQTDEQIARELKQLFKLSTQNCKEDCNFSTHELSSMSSNSSMIVCNEIKSDQKEILLRKFEEQYLSCHNYNRVQSLNERVPMSAPSSVAVTSISQNSQSFLQTNDHQQQLEMTQRIIIGSPSEQDEDEQLEEDILSNQMDLDILDHQSSHVFLEHQQSSSLSNMDDLISQHSFSQISSNSLIRPFPHLSSNTALLNYCGLFGEGNIHPNTIESFSISDQALESCDQSVNDFQEMDQDQESDEESDEEGGDYCLKESQSEEDDKSHKSY